MSTIRTVSDAYEALCAGEYFQVGDKIIDPEDVVRVDRTGEPTFYLSDGSAAQHKRFQKGSTGDLLAEALDVARRGQAQSEKVFPGANRILTDSQLYGLDGLVRNLNGAGATSVSPEESIIAHVDTANDVFQVEEYMGGAVTGIGNPGQSSATGAVIEPGLPTEKLFLFTNGSSSASVHRSTKDGATQAAIYSGVSGMGRGQNSYAAASESAVGWINDGALYAGSADGSAPIQSQFISLTHGANSLWADEEKSAFLMAHINAGDWIEIASVPFDLSKSETIISGKISGDWVMNAYSEKTETVALWENTEQVMYTAPLDLSKKTKVFSSGQSLLQPQDIAVDLSNV